MISPLLHRGASLSIIAVLVACGGSVASEGTSPESSPPSASDGRADVPRRSGEPSRRAATDPSKAPATANDRCEAPRRITLTDGRVELKDDTSAATDEFPSLDCESRGTADSLRGPQRYYELRVRQGRAYSFMLTPSFHAVLYGFDRAAGCTEQGIRSACRSSGTSGFASGLVNPGTGNPGATVFAVPPPFRPERDMDLVLAVDSDYGSGTFVLVITEE